MISAESYYIISDNKESETAIAIKTLKAVILVNLFYEDQVDFYQTYLEKIPDYIDIFIISSKDIILNMFNDDRYQKRKKENRGRDISALLVTAKDIFFQYDYVCFIHDKKEKEPETKEYVDAWRKNMWDNMLQSSSYIYNILELLASIPSIGMLVPIPPYGRDSGMWLNGSWGNNFGNVKQLAGELDINEATICYESLPITYSTAFWAKSKALLKLFSKNWKYTDFPDEPMRNDGEINHAIERILEYVVKDAGFEVKIALSTSYAAFFISQLNAEIKNLWEQLDRTIGIRYYSGLDCYQFTVDKIRNFARKYDKIYLYGGGKKGKQCLTICRLIGIKPKGFIITNPEGINEVEGLPVLSSLDVELDESVGIIISVGIAFQQEVEEELKKRGFGEYVIF